MLDVDDAPHSPPAQWFPQLSTHLALHNPVGTHPGLQSPPEQ